MSDADLYSEEQSPEPETPKTPEEPGEDNSTVIPKTALPSGAKVGDEITFRVTKDYGDEMGIEPVSETETPSEDNREIESMDVEPTT